MIAAEGEQKASRALREASEVISDSSSALQLRYLQVIPLLLLQCYYVDHFLHPRHSTTLALRRIPPSFSLCQLIWSRISWRTRRKTFKAWINLCQNYISIKKSVISFKISILDAFKILFHLLPFVAQSNLQIIGHAHKVISCACIRSRKNEPKWAKDKPMCQS